MITSTGMMCLNGKALAIRFMRGASFPACVARNHRGGRGNYLWTVHGRFTRRRTYAPNP